MGDERTQGLERGVLYVCATPLGNLGDLSRRTADVLRLADWVAAERPEHTLKLLNHLGIPGTKLRPCAESTATAVLEGLVAGLLAGEAGALVSDAGTPGISDPGSRLVRLAAEQGLTVRPIPGPSALTAAVSVSGFEASRLLFCGFPERRAGPRFREIQEALASGAVTVWFESPQRIRKTLEVVSEIAPQRRLVLLREATKVHEEIFRGSAAQVLDRLPEEPRGEFTLVVDASETAGLEVTQDPDLRIRTKFLLDEGLSPRDVVRALMHLCGLSKSKAFGLVQSVAGEESDDGAKG